MTTEFLPKCACPGKEDLVIIMDWRVTDQIQGVIKTFLLLKLCFFLLEFGDILQYCPWERSGSVVECLTGDQGVAGSSLINVTALCP